MKLSNTSEIIFRQKIFLLPFFFSLFLFGCANVISPTGGDKDTQPPKVLGASPANLSTNFSSHEIKISFDEYFRLNNPADEIYLSPIAKEKVKWKIRKKNLLITLPDSLKANTTYTLHFGNTIADNTEGNKLEGFSYVFSTGAVIDSFRIQGKVADAKTQKPQKSFLVMLYSSVDDSVVAKSKPDYFARTDESGLFSLEHLHQGHYKLFCLKDQNQNYLYDVPTEEIAFMDTMIFVEDTISFYSLNSLLPSQEKTILFSTTTSDNKKISFAFNHAVKDFLLEGISDSTQILFQSQNKSGDTLFVWIATKQTDSVFFQMKLNGEFDTVGVRLHSSSSSMKGTNAKFSMRTNLVGAKTNYGLYPNKKFEIYFSYPLKNIAKDILGTIIDSTGATKNTLFVKKIDSLTHLPFAVCNYDFPAEQKFQLKIPAGLFEDVYGNKNDSTYIQFRQLAETETGNLALTIICKDTTHHFIAQLLSGNSVSKEWLLANGKNFFDLKSLMPGAYKLQFIHDENDNGKWDSGDYWTKKQPEKIILYNKEITVRSNWDLEIDAEVGGASFGKMKK